MCGMGESNSSISSQEELIKWQTQVRETEKRPTTEHTQGIESDPSAFVRSCASERKRDGGRETTILNNVVMDYAMASMADGYR